MRDMRLEIGKICGKRQELRRNLARNQFVLFILSVTHVFSLYQGAARTGVILARRDGPRARGPEPWLIVLSSQPHFMQGCTRFDSIRFSHRTDSQVSIRFDSIRSWIRSRGIHIGESIGDGLGGYMVHTKNPMIYLTWAQAGPGPGPM